MSSKAPAGPEHVMRVLIYACDDVPGQWIAHWLDLDVITQGCSAEHAFTMAVKAARVALEDDREQRRDPYARLGAPWEDQVFAAGIMARGQPTFEPGPLLAGARLGSAFVLVVAWGQDLTSRLERGFFGAARRACKAPGSVT